MKTTKQEFGENASLVYVVAPVLLLMASLTAAGEADIHENPYIQAAAREGIPRELLVAIAGAESGFHPWALNIEGRQVYCRSRQEAEQLLSTVDKVDIGLMQINWPFWGPRLGVSKSQLLDPRTNLLYGARILKQSLARTGDIWWRISDYHAGSPQRRDRYNQLVYEQYLRYIQGKIGH
ncbi:MAG: lytic transglycosylase domain-containing protein [Deltaproteobacteria bacterium]|nr:lytic transglycosylase domain-containing protein [Deltaproteobacteria bacterium]